MKIQIENLRAQMRGVQLNNYQRALALDEYYKLLDYVEELEQLAIPAVVNSSKPTCLDCGDRGWLYDREGARTGICPCHYL